MGIHDNTCFRWRDFVMTERDELAYSRVLRELVPGILFYESEGKATSRLRLISNISESTVWQVYIAIPAPEQVEEWSNNVGLDSPILHPALYAHFQRSSWEWPDPTKIWAFDPPLIGWGNISVGFDCTVDAHRRLADTIMRRLNKVTTFGKRRFGLDACRWSQAGGWERRGLGPGELIDPSEIIELNRYYDDDLWGDGLSTTPTGVRV